MESLQPIIHYGLHFLFPGFIAWMFYRTKWKTAWIIMIATMLVDFDHLFSSPIFDPNRCSINNHYLHTYYAIGIYVLFLIPKKTRIIAIGLLLHMATDWLDCIFM